MRALRCVRNTDEHEDAGTDHFIDADHGYVEKTQLPTEFNVPPLDLPESDSAMLFAERFEDYLAAIGRQD